MDRKNLYVIGIFDEETEKKIKDIRNQYAPDKDDNFLPHITLVAVEMEDAESSIAQIRPAVKRLKPFRVTFDRARYFKIIKAASLFAVKGGALMDAFETVREAGGENIIQYYTNKEVYLPHTTLLWDMSGEKDYKKEAEEMKKRVKVPITGTVVRVKYSVMNEDGTFTILDGQEL